MCENKPSKSLITSSQELKRKKEVGTPFLPPFWTVFLVLIVTFFPKALVFFSLAYIEYSFPKHTVTIWKMDPFCSNEVSDHKILSEAKLQLKSMSRRSGGTTEIHAALFWLVLQTYSTFSPHIPLTTPFSQFSKLLTSAHNSASTLFRGDQYYSKNQNKKGRMASSLKSFWKLYR